MEKYFFISEYFLPLLIIKYNFMKTFTITKEQIEELSKWKHGKRLMQDWFLEAFEKQLEVGKVYKYQSLEEGKFMFKFNRFGVNNYGFNIIGEWSNNLGVWENEVNLYEEATEEEWLEALKEEAKRRGFIEGIKFNCPYTGEVEILGNKLDYEFTGYNSEKFGKCLRDNRGSVIFYNGIWSEIVKQEKPTQEEIDRVLDYLKNKNNS